VASLHALCKFGFGEILMVQEMTELTSDFAFDAK